MMYSIQTDWFYTQRHLHASVFLIGAFLVRNEHIYNVARLLLISSFPAGLGNAAHAVKETVLVEVFLVLVLRMRVLVLLLEVLVMVRRIKIEVTCW